MKKIARKSKTWSQNSFTIGSASVNELPFVFKTTLKEEKLSSIFVMLFKTGV